MMIKRFLNEKHIIIKCTNLGGLQTQHEAIQILLLPKSLSIELIYDEYNNIIQYLYLVYKGFFFYHNIFVRIKNTEWVEPYINRIRYVLC